MLRAITRLVRVQNLVNKCRALDKSTQHASKHDFLAKTVANRSGRAICRLSSVMRHEPRAISTYRLRKVLFTYALFLAMKLPFRNFHLLYLIIWPVLAWTPVCSCSCSSWTPACLAAQHVLTCFASFLYLLVANRCELSTTCVCQRW